MNQNTQLMSIDEINVHRLMKYMITRCKYYFSDISNDNIGFANC